MDNSSLKNFSTKQLIEELRTREGVKDFVIPPYERYQIINDITIAEDIGPAVILIVID